jgi:hypothetical protein
MKKSILTLAIALFLFGANVAQSSAQSGDNVFEKGSLVANLGIGLGGTMYGTGYGMKVPPLSLSAEYGIVDNLIKSTGQGAIGIAPNIGYSSYGWGDWSFNNLLLGVKGNFHYQFVPKLDTYVGLHLGYNIVSWDNDDGLLDNTAGSDIYWATVIGARYYFTNSFAVMAELGYGISWLNVGVALKLQ